jgi:hypothetical protein
VEFRQHARPSVQLHLHQDLHSVKPDYIDSRISTSNCTTTSSYVKIIGEFYIANINITNVYINVIYCRCRPKTPPPL